MASYKDLFNLHIKYIEYLLAKSYLSHQFINNITQSGSDVEQEVRVLVQSILPRRFRVTHGYIVYAPSKQQEPQISPQADLIIVDTLVPHSIFTIDKDSGMEIVPVESVVGIFEVKRTLNKKSLAKAIKHLSKILKSVGVTKSNTQRYLPGGVQIENSATISFNGGYYSNPIIGILGADHAADITIPELGEINNQPNWLDVVVSFQGLIYALCLSDQPNLLHVENIRNTNQQYRYKQLKTSQATSSAKIIATGLGYILTYVQQSSGSQAMAVNYFLNDKIQ